jgi:16S rRNA (cytidine1402-2'-O)-methyltransferase
VCIGREVTKTFEEFRYGSATEVADEIGTEKVLGECTLVIAPPADGPVGTSTALATEGQLDDLLRSLLEQGVPASTVAQALRVMPGIGRNQAYERVLALGRESR